MTQEKNDEDKKKYPSVFCRGCATKIHAEAKICPHCGYWQIAEPQYKRNPGILVVLALGYTVVAIIIYIALTAAVLPAFGGEIAITGKELARKAIRPLMLVFLIASSLLTAFGKLPGTSKHERIT